MRLYLGVAAASFLLAGPVSAQQEKSDMQLRSAGFQVRVADTPEQLEKMRRLPPREIVTRMRNGKRYYVYADPELCKCVFIGDQAALQAYTDIVSPPRDPGDMFGGHGGASEGMVIHEMDSDLGDNDIFGHM